MCEKVKQVLLITKNMFVWFQYYEYPRYEKLIYGFISQD
jgi:hypothetical protein